MFEGLILREPLLQESLQGVFSSIMIWKAYFNDKPLLAQTLPKSIGSDVKF